MAQLRSLFVPSFIHKISFCMCDDLCKLHLAFLDIESTNWLCTHENGLLEIFLMVCETSEAGFSGQDARRQQMSCAAAALLWPSGARFFATPRLRLNPHC